MVRGYQARRELEMLRMQLEAAVMLQNFMRMKNAQLMLMTHKAAVQTLHRGVRGMISRKIFAEGMAILNAKLANALSKLDAMLNSPDGGALVRQHLLIRNALPTPAEVKAGVRSNRRGPFASQTRARPLCCAHSRARNDKIACGCVFGFVCVCVFVLAHECRRAPRPSRTCRRPSTSWCSGATRRRGWGLGSIGWPA
jgi:hypothetical protein